jgi:peptide/nickel transport system permease protein
VILKRRILRRLRKDPGGTLGLTLAFIWIAVAAAGPSLVSDPVVQDLARTLLPPSWLPGGSADHPLGTDHLGRDLLSRIVYGARTSLVVGVVAVGAAAVLGSLIATVSATWGGLVDDVLMRIADVQLAIPFVLLAITVLVLLGGSIVNMILVLILAGWVIFARVIRSELLHLREMEFVLAARSIGVRQIDIAFRHLLPNTFGLIVVIATLELANVILLESALSFIGVGIRPPQVSWGTMIADGRNYLTSAWWLTTIPGAALTTGVFGVNLAGDLARDLLDPRRRDF